MGMKHYKDSTGQVHGLEDDGSQDQHIKVDWKLIADSEVQPFSEARQQINFDAEDWYRKRIYSYPELGEFVDAYIKGDAIAMEAYKQKCLEVKAKFPKPAGF
jgi:hypothetical protein